MAEVDGGDILIRIRGDASDLEDAINRSQGAITGLESGAGDAADVLGDMGSAAKKTKVDLKSMSGEGIGAVAAGLATVNPQAGALVGLFGQLRVLSGPLAVALGVVTAAFALYKHEVDRAAEAAEKAKERIEDFNDAFSDQAVIAEDLRNELRLINGEIDEDGLAHEKRKTRIQAAGDAVVKTIDAQIKAQRELIHVEEVERGGAIRNAGAVAELKAELERLTQERLDAIEATESQIAAADAIAEFNRETAESEALLAEKTNDASVALDAEAQRLAEVAEAARLAQVALNNLGQTQQQRASDRALGRDEEESAIEKFNRTIADNNRKHEQDTADEAAETQAKRVAFAESANEQIGQSAAEFATVMAGRNKKAALAAYRVSQASGIAETTISTAKAVAKAFELGPIFGPPAAVVMGALGAMQIATIAATPPPTAHIGTGMPGSRDPLAPDERMSGGRRVLTTEASGPAGVTNSMGTQLINDVNTGRVQSNGRITATIGRTHLDRELFRSGRRGTSRYARALRTNPHPKPQGGY